VVTGKGGTGKTTVAASLALALAAGGYRTLLVEVEGRQGIAQLFGRDPLPYEERVIATTPGGGEVRALAVDPEEALLEYLAMFYRLGAAGRALRKVGAIDFATTIAPGLRDVLLTGKVKEATTRKDGHGRRVYRAVVLDAPPTGRIGRFLNVTPELLAGVRKVTQAELRRGLVAAGLPGDRPTVVGLQEQAQAYLARQAVEEQLREELTGVDRPTTELPLLPGGVDFDGLRRLAALLGAA
jgi:anion-transporting  ArsA/GET3 family ATPase